MDVPQHISALGNVKERPYPVSGMANGGPYISTKMNVPERIIVAGDNKLMEAKAEATEVFADRLASETLKQALNAPPTTLTFDQLRNSDNDESAKQSGRESSRANSISQGSNFAIEDETEELRHQLGELSSRVAELERTLGSSRAFNFLSLSASAIAFIFSFLLILKKGL